MSATKPDVYAAIQDLLGGYNPRGIEITPELKLNRDLNLDSVAAMDVIMAIEDRFDIDIPINLIADIESVRDLVDLVESRLIGR